MGHELIEYWKPFPC